MNNDQMNPREGDDPRDEQPVSDESHEDQPCLSNQEEDAVMEELELAKDDTQVKVSVLVGLGAVQSYSSSSS